MMEDSIACRFNGGWPSVEPLVICEEGIGKHGKTQDNAQKSFVFMLQRRATNSTRYCALLPSAPTHHRTTYKGTHQRLWRGANNMRTSNRVISAPFKAGHLSNSKHKLETSTLYVQAEPRESSTSSPNAINEEAGRWGSCMGLGPCAAVGHASNYQSKTTTNGTRRQSPGQSLVTNEKDEIIMGGISVGQGKKHYCICPLAQTRWCIHGKRKLHLFSKLEPFRSKHRRAFMHRRWRACGTSQALLLGHKQSTVRRIWAAPAECKGERDAERLSHAACTKAQVCFTVAFVQWNLFFSHTLARIECFRFRFYVSFFLLSRLSLWRNRLGLWRTIHATQQSITQSIRSFAPESLRVLLGRLSPCRRNRSKKQKLYYHQINSNRFLPLPPKRARALRPSNGKQRRSEGFIAQQRGRRSNTRHRAWDCGRASGGKMGGRERSTDTGRNKKKTSKFTTCRAKASTTSAFYV